MGSPDSEKRTFVSQWRDRFRQPIVGERDKLQNDNCREVWRMELELLNSGIFRQRRREEKRDACAPSSRTLPSIQTLKLHAFHW